jgi:Domain of unknown function (DUF4352)
LNDGEVLDVTLTKVADPASPADEFSGPTGGNRLVATQFRLANTGTARYDDAIDNDVKLVDSAGQTYDSSFNEVSAGQSFGGDTRVNPGDSRLGYVAFEVPKDADITTVQFVPDSGFADDTGQWTMPSKSHSQSEPPSSSEAAAGEAVVREYFDAINAADYQRAWDLGGKNLDSSYSHFVSGFADTVNDTVTITGTEGDVVSITLAAEQSDGSTRSFEGTYTVKDGVITDANVHPQ